MALSNTKRQDILEEVIARLGDYFPDAHLERGFSGEEVKQFPSIFVFEEQERVQQPNRRPSFYYKELPVTVEYFFSVGQRNPFELGNESLYLVQSAIERKNDPYFAQFRSESRTDALVDSYGMTSNRILPMYNNIIDVVVEYEFRYYEAPVFAGT